MKYSNQNPKFIADDFPSNEHLHFCIYLVIYLVNLYLQS